MFNLSKNGIGIIMFVLGLLGVTAAESDVIVTIATLMQVVSGVIFTYHQVRERSDVDNFIFKK